MGLIICHSCGRRRTVEKIPLKVHTCTNCGARDVLTLRGKVDVFTNRTDEDGVDRETARHRTYAGLRMHQEANNYKPIYVMMKFRQIYGTKPNGETGTPAEPMTHELALWLKRDKTRFVASRRKIEEAERKPVKPEVRSTLMSAEDEGQEWR